MTDLTSTQFSKGQPRRALPARLARIIGGLVAGLLVLATVAGSLLYASVSSSLPDVSKLERYDPARTSKIFASDGTLSASGEGDPALSVPEVAASPEALVGEHLP